MEEGGEVLVVEIPDGSTWDDAKKILAAALSERALAEHPSNAAAARSLGLTREGFYKMRRRAAEHQLEASP